MQRFMNFYQKLILGPAPASQPSVSSNAKINGAHEAAANGSAANGPAANGSAAHGSLEAAANGIEKDKNDNKIEPLHPAKSGATNIKILEDPSSVSSLPADVTAKQSDLRQGY